MMINPVSAPPWFAGRRGVGQNGGAAMRLADNRGVRFR
jgi:hypothetical protein